MGRPKIKNVRQVHIRIKNELYDELEKLAHRENWNINQAVNEAVKMLVKGVDSTNNVG